MTEPTAGKLTAWSWGCRVTPRPLAEPDPVTGVPSLEAGVWSGELGVDAATTELGFRIEDSEEEMADNPGVEVWDRKLDSAPRAGPPAPDVGIPLCPSAFTEVSVDRSGFEGLAARLRRAGGWFILAMLGWPTKTGKRIETRSHNPPRTKAPITARRI